MSRPVSPVGAANFGTEMEWLDVNGIADIHYNVDPSHTVRLHDAIRRCWPGLREAS